MGLIQVPFALEFFEHSIQEMGKIMFPNGSPIHSSHHVQNGNFRTCGEIIAASIAQGGPPPCFLEPCSYQSAYQEIDMMSISSENLTTISDCKKYTELILENNYTGVIDEKHIEEIVGSLKVSFVTCRSIYMKEFMIGLNCYGLDNMIRKHPDECKSLFVNGDLENLIMQRRDLRKGSIAAVAWNDRRGCDDEDDFEDVQQPDQ
ncbi:hypothetical protein QZH41_012530, partial [Actinostola sp. cb2023]